MRKPTLLAVLCLSACSPEALEAMERHEPQVNELSHQVRVRFEDGATRLTVSRKLRNDTTEYQALSRRLLLPAEAIATSLRVSTDGAFPLQSTLTTSEEASAQWDLLTSPGDAVPSTLAKLEWATEGGLDLDLFGIAPGSTVTVEYDLELSPDYAAGELSFEYPREADQLAPEFQLGSARLDQVAAMTDAEDTSTGFKIRQPHDFSEPFLARWATYPLEVDRSLWRLEVDVAAQLAPTPVRPNVVFVVDGSHSEGPEGIASQLELIEPYLANVREAQVEIVIYRRFAERLFGRFVTGNDVARLLASTSPEKRAPGNGSNLELGARLAAESLAQVGGVGRMVIFTDEELRFDFTNEKAIEALTAAPRDTVVHVVQRRAASGASLSENRDDAATLAPIATAGGGVYFHIDGHPVDPLLSADTMLGLVRPVRIDDFEVSGFDELEVESVLQEGSTVRQSNLGAQPPEEIVLSGKIWAREVRQVMKLDRTLADRLPGLSIADESLRTQLNDEELKTVAFVAHAVSPVTSFFSAAPEAAASTIGTYGLGPLLGGSYGVGCGGCGSSTSCGWGHSNLRTDFDSLLRGLLAPAFASCGEASPASVRLEATGDEIVGVTVTASSPELTECLTEAVWRVRLSPEFSFHRFYELNQ